MADNKNMELNDAAMENAVGGDMIPGMNMGLITGIVMVDPLPDDPAYSGIWDECNTNGYQVYEINGGRFAVAGSHLPALTPGDKVALNQIRGYYGWEIEGVIDG